MEINCDTYGQDSSIFSTTLMSTPDQSIKVLNSVSVGYMFQFMARNVRRSCLCQFEVGQSSNLLCGWNRSKFLRIRVFLDSMSSRFDQYSQASDLSSFTMVLYCILPIVIASNQVSSARCPNLTTVQP